MWSPPKTTGTAPDADDPGDSLLETFESDSSMSPGRHLDVTDVHDAELDRGSTPSARLRTAAIVGQVVGRPDRLRAETTARPVGRPPVEWCCRPMNNSTARLARGT